MEYTTILLIIAIGACLATNTSTSITTPESGKSIQPKRVWMSKAARERAAKAQPITPSVTESEGVDEPSSPVPTRKSGLTIKTPPRKTEIIIDEEERDTDNASIPTTPKAVPKAARKLFPRSQDESPPSKIAPPHSGKISESPFTVSSSSTPRDKFDSSPHTPPSSPSSLFPIDTSQDIDDSQPESPFSSTEDELGPSSPSYVRTSPRTELDDFLDENEDFLRSIFNQGYEDSTSI